MKTLANCTPREFLAQTQRIRKVAAKWLKLTGLHELRARLPEVPADAPEDVRREAMQARVNAAANGLMDAMLEACPEATAELLGLMCFIEPEDLEDHSMAELLSEATALLNSPEVMGFFISLARLEIRRISDPANR